MFRLQACLAGLLVGLAAPLSAAVDVMGLRAWQAPDRTRLVFELSAQVPYEVFSLSDPCEIGPGSAGCAVEDDFAGGGHDRADNKSNTIR